MLILFEQIVGNINFSHYGGKVVNQNNFESLNKVMHSINIVKNPDNNIEVTNSRAKIKQLYTISPSLNNIKDNFEFSLNILTREEDGEISDGMFGWAFLSGVSMSHYSTYKEQTELFDNISSEINIAIENNILETQELIPIFQDSLKVKFNFKDLFLNIMQAINVINDYSSIKLMNTYESKVNYSDFYETRIRDFLEITHDKILLKDDELNWRIFGELVTSAQTEYIESLEPKIQKLNDIRTFYNDTANIIKILGYSSYIIMIIILIVDLIRKQEKIILNNWLIASGIIGSVFTLAAGVAYTSSVKIYLTNSFYLMSGYILNNVFCIICIITVLEYLYKIIKNLIIKRTQIKSNNN